MLGLMEADQEQGPALWGEDKWLYWLECPSDIATRGQEERLRPGPWGLSAASGSRGTPDAGNSRELAELF